MPDPSPENADPLNAAARQLRDAIAARGPLPFAEFMDVALYHPSAGYYGSGRAAIGRKGDFFTNVSVGPLFGTLIARQYVEMWERLERPARFELVEQGAHRGHFARDFLGALKSISPACYEATSVTLIEPAEAQRDEQAETLAELHGALGKTGWYENLSELKPFEGLHFSNELLDAFPVHRVSWNGHAWREELVGLENDAFCWAEGELSSEALARHLALLPVPAEPGYTTEVNLAAPLWIESLAPRLKRGFVLLIDYGYARPEYYRAERNRGTLSGYLAHQHVKDPLENPGSVDLTAHVDFTTLVERAETSGLRLHGFCDQHHFMVGLSRLHFTDASALSPGFEREMRAFKTLMHPTLMGTSFKALCLEKTGGAEPMAPLSGFAFAGSSRAALAL